MKHEAWVTHEKTSRLVAVGTAQWPKIKMSVPKKMDDLRICMYMVCIDSA